MSMECPNCGYSNPDGCLECLRCHRLLEEERLLPTYPPRSGLRPAWRRFRLWQSRSRYSLHQGLVNFLEKMRVVPVYNQELAVILAGLGSLFFPGLGQVLRGKRSQGMVIFSFWFFSLILALLFYGSRLSSFLYSVVFFLHCYAVFDCLRKLPFLEYPWKRIATSLGVAICVWLLYVFAVQFTSNYFLLFSVGNTLYSPSLQAGDYVLIYRRAYRKKSPCPGQVIYFHFPGALLERETVYVPSGFYLEKVIAGPGDFFSVKDGLPLVNDSLLKNFPLHNAFWSETPPQKLNQDSYLVFLPYRYQGKITSLAIVVTRKNILGQAIVSWSKWNQRHFL